MIFRQLRDGERLPNVRQCRHVTRHTALPLLAMAGGTRELYEHVGSHGHVWVARVRTSLVTATAPRHDPDRDERKKRTQPLRQRGACREYRAHRHAMQWIPPRFGPPPTRPHRHDHREGGTRPRVRAGARDGEGRRSRAAATRPHRHDHRRRPGHDRSSGGGGVSPRRSRPLAVEDSNDTILGGKGRGCTLRRRRARPH